MKTQKPSNAIQVAFKESYPTLKPSVNVNLYNEYSGDTKTVSPEVAAVVDHLKRMLNKLENAKPTEFARYCNEHLDAKCWLVKHDNDTYYRFID